MRYAGPDTGVARITLAPRDTIFAIGDPLPLRVAAFLSDGRPTSARFGFAVHGASAISVDAGGVLRARGPVAAGTTWVVTRTVTGLVDSAAVGALVPARSITLTPTSGRIVVGGSVVLKAVVRDSAGAPIVDREPAWNSSDASVASVIGGTVTGVGVGSATITAVSERATALAVITVLPAGVARVTISPRTASVRLGHTVTLSAKTQDALGELIPATAVSWRSLSPAVASVDASGVVRGLSPGHGEIVGSIDGVSDTVSVSALP